MSHKFEPWVNYHAKLYFSSCSTLVVITLQLPVWHLNAHKLSFLHTLSYTALTLFPPKYRVFTCWIISNLAQNKANTWLIKFNLTHISILLLGLVARNGYKLGCILLLSSRLLAFSILWVWLTNEKSKFRHLSYL